VEGLGRWQLARPLGAGAFGQVHLAWDTVDRRWVALKQFTGQDELGLLRFVIESRIRVEHPHLVSTLAFRLVDDQAWLVTELARGGSLRPLLNRGPLPYGWVAEVIDQTLDALSALHASGVIHRDIKPANLLLRDSGMTRPHILVGDFGIAAWRTVSMTGVGAAIGTPGYLAPEYLDGKPPSPQTDLFAVGVLAAELLCGRRLMHHSNAITEIPSDWDSQVPLPDGVPGHLADVLRRMSDPDPSRRYADCHQAREALRFASPPETRPDLTSVEGADLLSGLPAGPEPTRTISGGSAPVPFVPTPPSGVPAPPVTKRRGIAGLVVTCVALAVLGVAGFFVWRAVDKTPAGTGALTPGGVTGQTTSPVAEWTPTVVEPCNRVDIGRVRQNGEQRCQRTSSDAHMWVQAPPAGFPSRSNPAGPLPGENCDSTKTSDFSPTGTAMRCQASKWQPASG
jgi:hypothetical protein